MAKKNLTPRQIKAACLEASPESWELTQVEKAKQLGISHTTLGRWGKIPEFREYISRLVTEHAERMLPYAWACLKKRMASDTQAIKLYFELLGQHRQRLEVSGHAGGPVRLKYLSSKSEEELQQLSAELEELEK